MMIKFLFIQKHKFLRKRKEISAYYFSYHCQSCIRIFLPMRKVFQRSISFNLYSLLFEVQSIDSTSASFVEIMCRHIS